MVAVPEICQKTCRNFHRKEAGTAAYLGVVAVPRDMPEGTFVTGLVWGTFGPQRTDILLAEYLPRRVYSKLEQQKEVWVYVFKHSKHRQ